MKAKKLLALLLTMLMLVSSMAMATLPVLAEEATEGEEVVTVATIPAAKMYYYAGAADQATSVPLGTLTEGTEYILSLYATGSSHATYAVNGNTIYKGNGEVSNGAVYNQDTGVLQYAFTAAASNRLVMSFTGSNFATGYVGGVTVATTTGEVVAETTAEYVDGVLQPLKTGGISWGTAWGGWQYVTFADEPMTTFGVADPATCEHAYSSDCDVLCDTCGTFRVTAGHQYDDKYDEYCNSCNEYRFVATEVPVASLHFYAPFGFNLTSNVTGLIPGEVYTMSMFFKNVVRTGKITVDGTEIINGTATKNGATYDAATCLLTYSFVASADKISVVLDLVSNTTTVDVANLVVVNADGQVVYKNEATYDDAGNLTGNGWGASWVQTAYYNYYMGSNATFGATDPKLCEEHVYTNDCDAFCNKCATSREVKIHEYTDDTDSLCNVCQELRLPSPYFVLGVEMTYHANYGDQFCGRDFGPQLTIGETYTFTAISKNSGRGGFTFNGTIILDGATASNGATYDATTGLLTYTFVAEDTNEDGVADALIRLELFDGGSYTGQMINPTLSDAEGNVVVAPVLNEAGTRIDGWSTCGHCNAGGAGQYITLKRYLASALGIPSECVHRYAGPCDGTCDYCGETRAIGAHEYDDDADSRCNNCYGLRDGWVNALDGKGYESDDTFGYVYGIKGLTVGETYTLTFYWKAIVGTPAFRFWDGINGNPEYLKEIVKGMEAVDDNTTFDYKTGLVTHIFTADAEDVVIGMVMNTLDPENVGKQTRVMMADVVITDSMGEEFFRNDITTDPDMGWGWTGWSNRWGKEQRGLSFVDCLSTAFACTHYYDDCSDTVCNRCETEREAVEHVYDGGCDADCNVCGKVREDVAHEYDNACDMDCNVCGAIREVEGHVFDNNCDADCNECGELREVGEHVYSNACDVDCNECGATREVGEHVYDDDNDPDCNECGETREITPSYIPGDINGDGEVDNRDVTRLIRYLNEWDVEYVEAALDVNGDGEVDNRDATRLTRYINEWDVEIF